MVFRSTLSLCPECSCHVRDEQECPHCGADLKRSGNMRSAAALSLGLAVAMTIASGCIDSGPGPGDSDDDGSTYVGNSVVATYGVAPSVGPGGYGGFGGSGGNNSGSPRFGF